MEGRIHGWMDGGTDGWIWIGMGWDGMGCEWIEWDGMHELSEWIER